MAEHSFDEFRKRSQLLKGLDLKVFNRVVQGQTNLNIARDLNVPLTAVKGCRERLITFLGAKDGMELIRLGRESRLDLQETQDQGT